MKKRIVIGLVALLLIISLFIVYKTSPSGDINNYQNYFTDDTREPTNNAVKVTFFGVSTLLFDDGETQFLIDGFFSRYSLWKALATKIETDSILIDQLVAEYKMNRVKGIFVTHSHYDHAFDVAYSTKKMHTTLYGSGSTLNIARGGDVKEEQLSLFQPYQNIQLGKFTIQVIPSRHSPNSALKDESLSIEKPIRQPANMKVYLEGGSYDFLIKHNGKNIYVKPSPNFIEGALDSLKADVVFIGIATITKQTLDWQDKFYEQTVGTLKPTLVIPLHWDNFFRPISEHLVMLPRFVNDSPKDFNSFIEKTKADTIDFKILQGTKSIVLFQE
jgi:L-ascorbate metabolism protein UlaG (beta-lactamase superfamily)